MRGAAASRGLRAALRCLAEGLPPRLQQRAHPVPAPHRRPEEAAWSAGETPHRCPVPPTPRAEALRGWRGGCGKRGGSLTVRPKAETPPLASLAAGLQHPRRKSLAAGDLHLQGASVLLSVLPGVPSRSPGAAEPARCAGTPSDASTRVARPGFAARPAAIGRSCAVSGAPASAWKCWWSNTAPRRVGTAGREPRHRGWRLLSPLRRWSPTRTRTEPGCRKGTRCCRWTRWISRTSSTARWAPERGRAGEIHAHTVSLESQSHWGWKRPLRSSSPTINPSPPRLPNRVPKCHIHTLFEPLQGWGLPHRPGQPGPVSDRSFSKEIFPNIQSKPPLMQLEAIASRPMADYLGEETNPRLTTPSCQGAVESKKVSPQPPLLQPVQPQLPQPLLIRFVLQTPP